VTPKKAFFDSAEGVRIAFTLSGTAPADVVIRVLGGGGEVYRAQVPAVQPGSERVERWDGSTGSGKAAPDGSYRVLVGVSGGAEMDAGTVQLYGHRYPLSAPHSFRGAVGEFGAARNGGRIHHGFDVNAACGKPLFAVRGGTVVRRRYNGRLDGNFIVIRGTAENQTYRYSHLATASPLRRGERVYTGQLVGRVGKTGNARTIGCHLHFEIRRAGRWIDPEPQLRRWDRYS
jgi:murein DD-endopeptidase MepM/ murein hydrolase activator NlpD